MKMKTLNNSLIVWLSVWVWKCVRVISWFVHWLTDGWMDGWADGWLKESIDLAIHPSVSKPADQWPALTHYHTRTLSGWPTGTMFQLVGWLIDRLINWLFDRLIDWLFDRLIDWLFDRLIDWELDRSIDGLRTSALTGKCSHYKIQHNQLYCLLECTNLRSGSSVT